MERTTRDINSVAAAVEIQEGRGSRAGGTYISLQHLPRNLIDFSSEWFPGNLRRWKAAGFDLRDFFADPVAEAWEVAPAAHFWNGGVRINERCETCIPGLFAGGEGTAGIHGANRLAGNALTMTQVWGKRAGECAAAFARNRALPYPSPQEAEQVARRVESLLEPCAGTDPSPVEIRREIRRVAGELVGIVRREPALCQALEQVASLRKELSRQRLRDRNPAYNRELVEAFQNDNMLDVLEAVIRASLHRKESRGAMYRPDYPLTDDDNWLCNVVVKKRDGEYILEVRPVIQRWLSLPRGTRRYGQKGGGSHRCLTRAT
jgi:succinate dehydrogenase/fumarate reductase flavoprotein subunit